MVIVKPSGTHFLAASSIPVRLGSFLGIGSVLAIIALYLGNALGGSITERLPQGIWTDFSEPHGERTRSTTR